MNLPDPQFVYHGSKDLFDMAVPKRQVRKGYSTDGSLKTIFDEISFHATPYKWIALAYTNTCPAFEIDGKKLHYTIGVDLYNYTEEIEIYGLESLEKSLEKLYGQGGYLFSFRKEDFCHTEGLGNLEMITKDTLKPFSVEKIIDPVNELKKLGISFKFIDLSKPENQW